MMQDVMIKIYLPDVRVTSARDKGRRRFDGAFHMVGQYPMNTLSNIIALPT